MNISHSALTWRKATMSSADGSGCVEVAVLPTGGRAVRDGKDPQGPVLVFTPHEWRCFLDGAKKGEFD